MSIIRVLRSLLLIALALVALAIGGAAVAAVEVLFRKDKWETLTVKYDIGVVDYPFDGTDRDC
jgi:hypothetical protein